MYRCCIFDLDGTLVNSIHALSHTISLTMEAFGLWPIDEEHTRLFVGDGYKKLVERSLLFAGDEKLVHYEEALPVYQKLFRENCLYRLEAYDGIRELLAFLRGREIKLAVVSNKPHERTVESVEAIFGKDCFESILGEQENIPCKPDPTGVFLTMKRLGVKPEDCLYFGDTNTDMRTGQAAGVHTVGVTWGFRERAELEALHPEFIIDRPGEMKKVFA